VRKLTNFRLGPLLFIKRLVLGDL